jgi:hypothetical protein
MHVRFASAGVAARPRMGWFIVLDGVRGPYKGGPNLLFELRIDQGACGTTTCCYLAGSVFNRSMIELMLYLIPSVSPSHRDRQHQAGAVDRSLARGATCWLASTTRSRTRRSG